MSDPRARRNGAGLLIVAAVLAAGVGLIAGWWVSRPSNTLDQYERLGGEIGCTCGDCPLRPIATCGCSFADRMLADLQQLVGEGNDDRAIMAAFVDQYGELVRIAPHGSGLDLAVWAAPMMALTLGAVAMGALAVRWVRSREATPIAGDPVAPFAGVAAEPTRDVLLARVEADLAELDG